MINKLNWDNIPTEQVTPEMQRQIISGEKIMLASEALMIGDVQEMDSWAPPRKDWLDGTDTYLKEG